MPDTKRCLIIGNGPSLKDIPNEFLDKYTTFGSNRVYLKYTPDYYAFSDRLWLKHYIKDIIALDCKMKFIRWEWAHLIPGAVPLRNWAHGENFSFEPFKWVWDGCTVTFVHLQLAYYFGYEEVGLIGVDHNYNQFYKEPHGTVRTGKEDAHFTKDYYDDHVSWWVPNLEKTTGAYKLAKKVYEADGRKIINLTPGSLLDVYEREDWQAWQ